MSETLDQRIQVANAQLGVNPRDEQAGVALACSLALKGSWQGVFKVFEHFAAVGDAAAAMRVCAGALRTLLTSRALDDIIALAAASTKEQSPHILLVYYAGCAHMLRGEMVEAVRQFAWFRDNIRYYMSFAPFRKELTFNVILRQARMIMTAAQVDALLAAQASAQPDVAWHGESAQGGTPVLLATFDENYFSGFGARSIRLNRDANPSWPLHVHVIAPSDASRAVLAGCADAWPGQFSWSEERQPFFHTLTYYACARFFVAADLIRRLGRRVISIDGDAQLHGEARGLDRLGAHCDFACFNSGRDEPASVWDAAVMIWNDTPRTLAFTDMLQRYCLPELGRHVSETWMLDQAALFTIKHYCEVKGTGLQFCDLAALSGQRREAFTTAVATEGEKNDLKSRTLNSMYGT